MLKLITFCALAAVVTPVAAQASDTAATKTVTIKVGEAAFGADGAGRLCLPRTTIDKSRRSELPKTMCLTQAEWEAKGVGFETRQARR